MELFTERGYDNVTVAQIAERAGLAKRTFFRHFADKPEVLFSDQEALRQLFADAIVSAPVRATPLEAVRAAVSAFAADLGEERRDAIRNRQIVVDANPDLRERELLKKADLTTVMVASLAARGVERPAATLAAQVGALAFDVAFQCWLEPDSRQTLAELAEQALRELSAAAGALTLTDTPPATHACTSSSGTKSVGQGV